MKEANSILLQWPPLKQKTAVTECFHCLVYQSVLLYIQGKLLWYFNFASFSTRGQLLKG